MNTKITFSCTNINPHGITKIIFEAITDEDINDDAIGWVDDNISKHYDEFELDFVLDWNVISCVEVEDDVKETKIINTVDGKLIFEDSIDWSYYRIGKYNFEIKQIKKETKKIKAETKKLKEKTKNVPPLKSKKDYPSVWIEPSGEVHELGFAQHEEFASDWLQENEPQIFEAKFGFTGKDKYEGKYCYEILQVLGWVRILGWKDPPCFVIESRITVKQKTALRDYCLNNEVPYNAFPEILKS
jgi:hypothetical protein